MEIEKSHFIRLSLGGLGLVGLNPLAETKRTWLLFPRAVPLSAIVFFSGISAWLEIIINFDGTTSTKFKNFLQFGLFFWVICLKLSIFYIHKDKFYNLLKQTEHTLANHYNREAFSEISQGILRFCEKFQIGLFILDALILLQLIADSLFQEKRTFFVIAYNQDYLVSRSPYFEIIYGFHMLYYCIGSIVEVSWLGMFGYFIAYVVAEFRMIKILLRECNLDTKNSEDVAKLRNVIRQHDFIVTFIKDVNSAFGVPLLVQIFVVFLFFCIALFSMVLDGIPPDVNHILEFGLLASFGAFNLSVICIFGQILINESSGVSDILFYKDWTKDGVYHNQIELGMIIQREQQVCCISIGGVFKLDLQFYAFILRKAFSLIGCLHTIKDNLEEV